MVIISMCGVTVFASDEENAKAEVVSPVEKSTDADTGNETRSQIRTVVNASLTLGIPLAYLGMSMYCYESKFKNNRGANRMGTFNAYALSTFGFAAAGFIAGGVVGSVIPMTGGGESTLQQLLYGLFGAVIGISTGAVVAHYANMPRKAKGNRVLYYTAPAASMLIPIVVFSRHF